MNTLLSRFASPRGLASCVLLPLLSLAAVEAAVTTDSLGWTVITPSTDSIIVYVSNAGNDSNNGLTPATAKATIAGADALIRDGYPDHLRLRRGDTFVDSFPTVNAHRWKNGRSASEPMVMEAYGSSGARPIITFSATTFIDHNGQNRNYQAYIGLDIYKPNSDPASPDFTSVNCGAGMRFVGGGDSVLVEDCRFRFCNVIAQSYLTVYTNFSFLRNIVTDNWVNSSYTWDGGNVQGMYLSGVNGYTVEENFYDHNGWSEVVAGAGANQFNHNLYVNYNNIAGGVMRGNIFARGAAHGLQARSGGIVERNLFVLNAIGFNTGYSTGPTDPNVLTFANTALNNVILNGRAMGADSAYPRTGAVWGIWKQPSIPNVVIDDNIVANRVSATSNSAMPGVTTLLNNIIYQWETARDMTNAAWPHPADDLGDFYASIGGTNSTTDYLNYLRNRPIHTLPWTMTAYAAINYIRAGFNKTAVTGLFNYAGSNLLTYGDFQPDAATTLGDMPSTYTLGTDPLNKWQGRVGPGGGQASILVSNAGDNYIDTGSGNTPGTFQVILYPGAGQKVLTYSYRGSSTVKVFTGVAGNTIAKFTGANTLTLVQSFTDTTQAAWTPTSHTVTLSGSPTYVVIQLLNGDFDNVSFASP